MCDECVELDSKIEHYRFMASRVTDQPPLDGIKELIERMQAQKLALHPEQAK
jgi:beta-phosphoglucomutase-like phosphatase (HAD superfamily)